MKSRPYRAMEKIIRKEIGTAMSISSDVAKAGMHSPEVKRGIYRVAKMMQRLYSLVRNELLASEDDEKKFLETDHLVLELEAELRDDGAFGPLLNEIDRSDMELKKLEDEEIDLLRNNRRLIMHISEALFDVNELQRMRKQGSIADFYARLHKLGLTLAYLLEILELDVSEDRAVIMQLKSICTTFQRFSQSDRILAGMWKNQAQERFVREIIAEIEK